MNFKKFKPEEFNRPLLGECDYFSTYELDVSGSAEIKADKGSFISLTFVEGTGFVNDISFAKGDTFFIPAGKMAEIRGNARYLLTMIK